MNSREITNSYRSSRRNTSLFSGLAFAWSAAQLEVKSFSLGGVAELDVSNSSVSIILGILCVYSMTRCTIEYMMQGKYVRGWELAQLDYRLTLYLARLAILVLGASTVARTTEVVGYVVGAAIAAFLFFPLLTVLIMLVIMPIRMFFKKSVASAVMESLLWALVMASLLYILFIILIALSYIQPFELLGSKYSNVTGWPIAIFASLSLLVLLSFFLDNPFLKMVFGSAKHLAVDES